MRVRASRSVVCLSGTAAWLLSFACSTTAPTPRCSWHSGCMFNSHGSHLLSRSPGTPRKGGSYVWLKLQMRERPQPFSWQCRQCETIAQGNLLPQFSAPDRAFDPRPEAASVLSRHCSHLASASGPSLKRHRSASRRTSRPSHWKALQSHSSHRRPFQSIFENDNLA